MALQSSGAISLANLQSEYGGSNPISMSEYYRNGGLVPNSISSTTPARILLTNTAETLQTGMCIFLAPFIGVALLLSPTR